MKSYKMWCEEVGMGATGASSSGLESVEFLRRMSGPQLLGLMALHHTDNLEELINKVLDERRTGGTLDRSVNAKAPTSWADRGNV